jgi:hypothetical protein
MEAKQPLTLERRSRLQATSWLLPSAIILFLLFGEACCSFSSIAQQAPEFIWAHGAVGAGHSVGTSIAIDANENASVTGLALSSSIAFDNFTQNGPGPFVVTYDPTGNVIGLTNSPTTSPKSVTDHHGNTYKIEDNTDRSDIGDDVLITKTDSSNNFVWSTSIYGSSLEQAVAIGIDVIGNIYVTGNFYSQTVHFDSNAIPNSVAMTTGDTTKDLFIVKYDADGHGIWARGAGGGYFDESYNLAVDNNGNCYVAGHSHSDSYSFGNSVPPLGDGIAGNHDQTVFVVKYDTNGDAQWATSSVPLSPTAFDPDEHNTPVDIAVDFGGNSYILGEFTSASVDFNQPGQNQKSDLIVSNHPEHRSDIFIVKYGPTGKILWATSAGGSGYDEGHSIAVNGTGSIFITGEFHDGGVIDFVPYPSNSAPNQRILHTGNQSTPQVFVACIQEPSDPCVRYGVRAKKAKCFDSMDERLRLRAALRRTPGPFPERRPPTSPRSPVPASRPSRL